MTRTRRTLLIAIVTVANALVPAGSASAFVPPTCGGERVTISGTDGPDEIFGTNGPDVIHAGPGDDLIFGFGGDDILCGGTGQDILRGGSGDDILIGGTDGERLRTTRPDAATVALRASGDTRASSDVAAGGTGTDVCEGVVTMTACEERGPLLRPHDSPVTWVYQLRLHPIFRDYRMHFGWDFGGECGDPLRAPADGIVILAGWKDALAGNAVRIDHGSGLVTAHAHLSEVWVEVGDVVEMGEVFGLVGETGAATECHLHTETHLNGDRVDPVPYWCPSRYFRPGMVAGHECPDQ